MLAPRPLRALTRFATFLDARGITGTSGIDRAVLEDYLADLQATMGSRQPRAGHIGMTGASSPRPPARLGTCPAGDRDVLPWDQPRRGEQLPRALAGHVMTQVENPVNLARQRNPAYRLATLILIRCRLRSPTRCGFTFNSSLPTTAAPSPQRGTTTTR